MMDAAYPTPERQLEGSQRHGSSFKNGAGDGRGDDRRQRSGAMNAELRQHLSLLLGGTAGHDEAVVLYRLRPSRGPAM
jgi:hypothetical protein